MTTHAKPEPIRLPVIREFDTGNGTFQQIGGYLFVTPDIARQIVAMAGIPRLDTDFIVSTEQRIAALEADVTWLKAHAVVGGADGCDAEPTAPCPICTMPMNDFDGGCVRHGPEDIAEWVKEHAQPAAPDADEAAKLSAAEGQRPTYRELRTEVAALRASRAKLAGLLAEAYGFTTADTGLLPERIKAALAEVQP